MFERLEASAPAALLGIYPADLMAERIRLSVAAVTTSGFRSARETVIADTPAIFATSDIFAPGELAGGLAWRSRLV
jgi:hypothetical protein